MALFNNKIIIVLIVAYLIYRSSKITNMQLTKNFNLKEFTRNGNELPLELLPNMREVAQNLELLREYLGKPININSGYRNPAYNAKIGGAKNSFHMKGMASDIHVKGLTPLQVHTAIEQLISLGKMKQGGLGLYGTFVHYDIQGVKRRWQQ
jgi:uncharacterized protein YcbK (DUF882 family)